MEKFPAAPTSPSKGKSPAHASSDPAVCATMRSASARSTACSSRCAVRMSVIGAPILSRGTLSHGTRPPAPLATLFGLCAKVTGVVESLLLTFELALGLQARQNSRVPLRRCTHGASRFLLVFAVPEAALRGHLGEISENLIDPRTGIPKPELAGPGVSMIKPPPGSSISSRCVVV